MQNFHWTAKSTARNRLTQQYEPVQPVILFEFAKEIGAKSFFDIGANIGYYSILMSQLPGIQRIDAFEASNETFAHLLDNVEMNGLGTMAVCHEKAVSSSDGILEFQIESELSGINSVVGTSMHSNVRFNRIDTVESCALDSVSSLKNSSVALKIDVEGHELEVIKGAVDTLRDNEALIQLELYGEAHSEAEKILSGLGYRRIFTVGHDFYFTNSPALASPDAVLQCVEHAMGAMVNFTRGIWPKPDHLPRISIDTNISNRYLNATCHVSQTPFRGNPDFAFNVLAGNQRIGGRDFDQLSSFDFETPSDFFGKEIFVQAIARDSERPNRVMSTRVSFTAE